MYVLFDYGEWSRALWLGEDAKEVIIVDKQQNVLLLIMPSKLIIREKSKVPVLEFSLGSIRYFCTSDKGKCLQLDPSPFKFLRLHARI